MAAIAIVVIVVWLAVFVVLPVVLLNSALALTILAVCLKNRRTLFAALAIVGAGYMLLDVGSGWLSALFVNNVVQDRVWITVFAYLNAAALALSTWFLVQPLWSESLTLRETDQQKSVLLMIGAILLVAAPAIGLPLIYHNLPLPAPPVENRAGGPQTRSTSGTRGSPPDASNPGDQRSAPVTTDIGRSGSLLTNVNLRSCADKSCDSLGEQFKDARFRIMETIDKDGILWYKIQITQQGCHALNPSWCGKKLLRDRKNLTEVNRSHHLDGDENASDTGWINSYNRELDVYTVSLD